MDQKPYVDPYFDSFDLRERQGKAAVPAQWRKQRGKISPSGGFQPSPTGSMAQGDIQIPDVFKQNDQALLYNNCLNITIQSQ